MPLWLALYQPYDQHTSCNLVYSNQQTARILRRILRLPHLADRLISADGTPLGRPAEPLRYSLTAPQNGSADYHLCLLMPDGSAAPPILLTAPGRPFLYLTEHALFAGPPPHGHEMRSQLRIPAPALETPDGLHFLDHLQVDLPPALAARTRRIPVQISLHCEVRPISPGARLWPHSFVSRPRWMDLRLSATRPAAGNPCSGPVSMLKK